MNVNHKKLLKRLSLGDKEGLALLTQCYYDTPEEGREGLIVEMVRQSRECGRRIKDVLLEQVDIEDRARARIKEEVEAHLTTKAEGVRGEDLGGADVPDGEGRVPE